MTTMMMSVLRINYLTEQPLLSNAEQLKTATACSPITTTAMFV